MEKNETPAFTLDQRVVIAELARRSGINANQLMECFKYQYGITINGYLQKTRMKKAVELLTDTDLKVEDIAQMIGYANASKLAEFFRESHHMSPLQYRRGHRAQIKMALECPSC